MGKSYSYSAKRDSARFSSKLGLLVLAVALLAALGWALTGTRLDSLLAMIDRESPTVQIRDQVQGAGAQEVSFTARLADNRAGVEKLAVWIDQDGAQHSIMTRDFDPPTKDSEVALTLPRLQEKLKEGPARLILG
ncbi:MAG: hypothetical protein J0M12_16820, partial [Deltaproteobacteria bacterium]|nr:hypothetical protein [Deltaproteobacteria bacterium]